MHIKHSFKIIAFLAITIIPTHCFSVGSDSLQLTSYENDALTTELYKAIRTSQTDYALSLIKENEDLDALSLYTDQNNEKQSVIEFAEKEGNKKVVDALMKNFKNLFDENSN